MFCSGVTTNCAETEKSWVVVNEIGLEVLLVSFPSDHDIIHSSKTLPVCGVA